MAPHTGRGINGTCSGRLQVEFVPYDPHPPDPARSAGGERGWIFTLRGAAPHLRPATRTHFLQ
ncbi:penicillin-binding protein 1B, mrcB [Deinococcus grandis]|uniref:Penicillin-binding protein 1B, mrcB n=1 Tax=Deinococcus grandis TaxID=57498 RepID=A0A117DN29_9DEIO|nr:hypothetical protein DEGR_22610 [Deinococcus grandis]GAQ20984.1 penicillin-binding protein 1B, mrcB [Deinococcus grandis]